MDKHNKATSNAEKITKSIIVIPKTRKFKDLEN
jgi:hypothetical protein